RLLSSGCLFPFSSVMGFACEYVRSPAWVLDFGIGITFDELHVHKSRSDKLVDDNLGIEEYEVQRNLMTEELFDVNRLLPHVERYEQPAIGLKNPVHLCHCLPKLSRREMNDSVEPNHPSHGGICDGQREHVAVLELDAWIPPLRFAHHLRRNIQTAH